MSAPQVTTNTFNGGMNQDASWDFFKPDEYREAVNFRPTTDDEGDSTGSLSLIKGNKLSFPFPSVYNVITLEPDSNFVSTYLDGSLKTITIDIDSSSINYEFQELELDNFYDNLVTFLRDNYSSLVIQTNGSKVLFYNSNGNSVINITGHTSIISTSDVDSELTVLGYTRLREETIIFTCPITPDGSGQIWKLSWDSNDIATITLVRHASDNFSPEYEIEAKSRYENVKIKRAYWTDNYNSLRGINIESDSTFLDLVDLIPAINYSVPEITGINQTGGSLKTGLYSYAYRLKNLQGNETTISRFSPNIHIVESNEEDDDHWDIVGSEPEIETKKSILGKIENLDITYEYLDLIVAYATKEGSVPFYYVIEENVSIDGDETYIFEHSVLDELNSLTEAELISPTAFDKCKSIEILNNRLYVANVKGASGILEDYDFTSIRTDKFGTTNGYETSDDKLNPYNRDSTSKVGNSDQYKYKGSSGILGGAGDLVDFEFITQDFLLDWDYNIPSGRNALWKLKDSDKINSITLNGKDYSMGNLWNSYKNPLFASLFKSYMRTEVYRFGVEFFDRRGNTLGVKWIADIRMPEHADFPAFKEELYLDGGVPRKKLVGKSLGVKFEVRVPIELQNNCSGFRIVRAERTSSDETVKAQGLIEDVASFLIPTPDGTGKDIYTYKFTRNINTYGRQVYNQTINGITTPLEPQLKLCNFPQFAFDKNYNEDLSFYKLRPICSLEPADRKDINEAFETSVSGQDDMMINKYWTPRYLQYQSASNTYYDNSIQIENSAFVNAVNVGNVEEIRRDDIFTTEIGSNNSSFINYSDADTATAPNNIFYKNSQALAGRGNNCYAMRIDGVKSMQVWDNLQIDTDLGASSRFGFNFKALCNLYRELPGQYGGSSKNAIEKTKYIPVGHYQAIISGINTYTCEVFGGDTYVNVYDEASSTAAAGGGALDNIGAFKPAKGSASGYTCIYPVESRVNIDLRNEGHVAIVGAVGATVDNLVNSDDKLDFYKYNQWLSLDQKTDFGLSLTSFATFTSEHDNRVLVSGAKSNGESIDSWSEFRVNDRLDVDGNYGPINKIGVYNDKLLFWQDRAFGYILSKPRIQTQGTDDISIQLGVSQDALYDFDYASTKIGSYHQKSIFQSPTGWYWFDINNKRPYKYGGQRGIEEFAEMKGMHSFFSREVDNNLLGVERNPFGQGIHGTYDYINNEAIFTFNSPKVVLEEGLDSFNANSSRYPGLYIPIGTNVKVGGQDFVVIQPYTAETGNLVPLPIMSPEYLLPVEEHLSGGFTIAMNHLTQKWSAFYGFKPNIYINTEDKVLSPNPSKQDEVYLHNVGEYSNFYGKISDAKLKLVVNKEPLMTKVWDNISWHNKTRSNYGSRGKALDTSTFSEFYCHTDYQHSGIIPLEQDGINRNLVKVEGEWRMAVPANVVTETGSDIDILDPNNWDSSRIFKDRMRDKYIVQSFTYKPEDAQFILDYINNYFRISHR